MAETPLKHQREEAHDVDVEENKRQKSYNHILSILEDEEEEPTQDLTSFIITIQQELSSDSTFETLLYPCLETDPEILSNVTTTTDTIEGYPTWSSSASSSSFSNEEAEDERERFMRHLLEASDDELGIPGREEAPEFLNNGSDVSSIVNGFSLCDRLWEFEDANANYYDLVQSELLMSNTC